MIRRISHGYEITIRETRATILRVYDNGIVEDMSGAPVSKSDVSIAATQVPAELKIKMWAWWEGYSSR